MNRTILAILGAFCVFSCQPPFGSTERIRCILPPLPGTLIAAMGKGNWEITVTTARGSRTLLLPGEESETSLEAETGSPLAISARFRSSGGMTYPSGSLYPHDLEPEGALRLTFQRGFRTACADKLVSSGFDISRFNWLRLDRELSKRQASPWYLDMTEIMDTILGGSFSASLLAEKPLVSISIPGCAGYYSPSMPPFLPIAPDHQGTLIVPVPPPGLELYGEIETIYLSFDRYGKPSSVRIPF